MQAGLPWLLMAFNCFACWEVSELFGRFFFLLDKSIFTFHFLCKKIFEVLSTLSPGIVVLSAIYMWPHFLIIKNTSTTPRA